MSSSSYDPFKLMASGIALWADTARVMQSQYVAAATRAAEQMPGPLQWKTVEVPMFSPSFGLTEEQLREAFQTSANINVNAWMHTANILDALPKWAHLPSQLPGRALTDLFDNFRAVPDHSKPD